MNNVDDILIMGKEMEKPESVPVEIKKEVIPEDTEINDQAEETALSETEESKPDQEIEKEIEPEEKPEKVQEFDEYGNEIPKPRTYTDEDVQKIVRDRLARVKQPPVNEQPTQQQQTDARNIGFQFNENSDLDWQQQLANFVDHVVTAREEKRAQQTLQNKQQQEMQEFQDKFNRGMNKYPDFLDVMQHVEVSDSMVVATSSLADPASFLYAAAKRHGDELNRISKLPNPFQQASELGRLEERMRKEKTPTKAERPIQSERSDVIEKVRTQPDRDIDRLIQKDAKAKLRRR